MTSGEASIITELVAKVGELVGRIDATEKERSTLRAADDHWRERMEAKTDKMFERLDEMGRVVDGLPQCIDEQVAAELAAAHKRRQAHGHRFRAGLVVVGVVALLFAAAALEFINREDLAGTGFAALAVFTPLAVWYLGKRPS